MHIFVPREHSLQHKNRGCAAKSWPVAVLVGSATWRGLGSGFPIYCGFLPFELVGEADGYTTGRGGKPWAAVCPFGAAPVHPKLRPQFPRPPHPGWRFVQIHEGSLLCSQNWLDKQPVAPQRKNVLGRNLMTVGGGANWTPGRLFIHPIGSQS